MQLPLSSRPPLVAQLSNSVPNTPHQYARDFTRRSRTPSPTGALGSHSPRSVVSEANGYLSSLPRSRPVCKYETSSAFSRRRIPYNIGDELLLKEKGVKRSLDEEEERRLENDMADLFRKLEPSKESEQRRQRLVEKLEEILHREWPGNEFKVHVFGSSGNLLCTSDSDVDICIQTSMKKLETMHILAEALANNGMQKVICVASAKVPIVKIWDPELNLACDMNVNNTLALENTRMIKTYVQIDKRVRPLTMIIKYWTKQRILNDAGIGGTLSSYSWICMIINFLQTRNPPVLPTLHQSPHKEAVSNDGTDSGFADDLAELQDKSSNEESLAELLVGFYRKYAHELDYERSVISVRQGRVLTRKEKGWDGASKEGQWRLCIEEPFNTSRNLGNSADSTAFRGIHLELRRAFDFLANKADLDGCCVAFKFPVEEKSSHIFRKPAPKAALQPQLPSQGTRGGRGGMARRIWMHFANRSTCS
ncbi:Nucleotidyltransferase [Eremomyces bilateralis CBS 781.70]|uniref:polynucleotide adenylyltransferase n=1 Tax=Eremomyces bilateralis CBS 781.70 TaxID=1392243 RepID=A0A6G1G330_9PEZI|nr:Nucleotidyltransferase [Eremomyces bilateralis CBS 781.70]KAF1812464.1 Nucleotidyltransferase [Eremomyces bilateralis CBS 781.70]